jgi:pimeloyl-ACP methyl ester carboxylesterase
VTGRFALLGLSYGGIIAFEIMRRAPERVGRLILLNTNFRQPSDSTRANQERWVGMACLGRFEEVPGHPDRSDAAPGPRPGPGDAGRRTDMARSVGKEGFVRQVKAQLGRPDSRADLPGSSCPTLLITGQGGPDLSRRPARGNGGPDSAVEAGSH